MADNEDTMWVPLEQAGKQILPPHRHINSYININSCHLFAIAVASDAGAGGDVQRTVRLLCCGGLAGAISRTLTAPIDRLKFLCQVHRTSHLTVREVGGSTAWLDIYPEAGNPWKFCSFD